MTVLRFAPALGDWVRQHLDQGQPPAALIQTMRERGMDDDAAQAIVAAFMRARHDGTPWPIDRVEVAPDEREPPRLRRGSRIAAHDRTVRVAARAERPVLALLSEVIDAAECAELIEMARGRLEPSTLVDPASGRDVVSGLRASSGMFFRPFENALVARLDRRLAQIMNLPVEHGEGLQVLHYPSGAGSAPHHDFLLPTNAANQASIARSGQRVSTMVTYLNDVPEGGETLFPEAGWAVSPQRGNAVYFEYCNRHGELDHASLHGSNAVRQGEKWVATKWMRARPFVSAGAA